MISPLTTRINRAATALRAGPVNYGQMWENRRSGGAGRAEVSALGSHSPRSESPRNRQAASALPVALGSLHATSNLNFGYPSSCQWSRVLLCIISVRYNNFLKVIYQPADGIPSALPRAESISCRRSCAVPRRSSRGTAPSVCSHRR